MPNKEQPAVQAKHWRGFVQREAGTVRRGFTLVELLVVIGIIAVLAAILFPVFARARESAHRVACLSNVRQLCLGYHMYLQDYDDRFWPFVWGVRTWGDGLGWCELVYPYVRNRAVYLCPSFSTSDAWVATYMANSCLDGTALDQVREPAACIVLYDGGTYPLDSDPTDEAGDSVRGWLWTGGSHPSQVNDPRHFRGYNITFVDSHAKFHRSWSSALTREPRSDSTPVPSGRR